VLLARNRRKGQPFFICLGDSEIALFLKKRRKKGGRKGPSFLTAFSAKREGKKAYCTSNHGGKKLGKKEKGVRSDPNNYGKRKERRGAKSKRGHSVRNQKSQRQEEKALKLQPSYFGEARGEKKRRQPESVRTTIGCPEEASWRGEGGNRGMQRNLISKKKGRDRLLPWLSGKGRKHARSPILPLPFRRMDSYVDLLLPIEKIEERRRQGWERARIPRSVCSGGKKEKIKLEVRIMDLPRFTGKAKQEKEKKKISRLPLVYHRGGGFRFTY